MKISFHQNLKKWKWDEWLLLFVYLSSILFACATVFRTSLHLMDSEACADMLLAHRIFQTRQWLPQQWYIDADHGLLGNYLAFVPFFGILTDWRKIRFLGTILLLGLLMVSFLYLCRKARFSRRATLVGSSLMLLPTSIAYGRNVLYHTQDIPYLALSFLLIALLLALWEEMPCTQKRLRSIFHGLCLLLVAFACGLNGFRQAMVTMLPFVLTCAVLLIRDRHVLKEDATRRRVFFIVLPAVLCSFACGYLLYRYWMGSHATVTLPAATEGDWILWGNQLLYGYMHTLGYRHRVPVFSLFGLLAVASLAVILILTWRGMLIFWNKNKEYAMPIGARITTLMFPASIVGMIAMAFITPRVSGSWFWLPALLWAVPFLCAWITCPMPKEASIYSPKHPFLIVLTCCIMLFNGFANTLTFLQPGKYTQYYDGGDWFFINTADYLEPLRAHLADNGYDKGYCSFQIGNVLTELSSGQLQTATIHISDDGTLHWQDRLTDASIRTQPSQKPFLVIEWKYAEAFQASPAWQMCRPLMEGVDYYAYEVIDEEGLLSLLGQ